MDYGTGSLRLCPDLVGGEERSVGGGCSLVRQAKEPLALAPCEVGSAIRKVTVGPQAGSAISAVFIENLS
jgi:hypothetical protein